MKNKILKDASKFTIANYLNTIVQLVLGVLIRRILGPMSMGILSELLLVFDYAKSNHLGILDAMDREIPILNGRNDPDGVRKVTNAGFTGSLLTSIVITAALIIASFFMQGRYAPRLVTGIRLIAFLIIPQTIVTLYIVLIRTRNRFGLLSRYIIFLAIVDITLKLFLIIKFGLYGFLWGLIFTAAIGLVYLVTASKYSVKIQISHLFKETRRLLIIGFPLLLSAFGFMTLCRIDRFFIIGYLDETELGYYSIATMFSSYIFLLPNLAYAVIFPRFYEEFGRVKGEIKAMKNFFLKPTLIFAYLFPMCIGFGIMALPVFLNYLLPKFKAGLIPAVILLAGTLSISIVNMGQYLLTALDKQYRIVVITAISIAASAILHYILLGKLRLGLIGVSLAMTAGYLVYSTILLCDAFRHFTKKIKDHVDLFVRLYLPMLWVMAVIYVLNIILAYRSTGLTIDLFIFAARAILFILFCSPILSYVNRETSIFSKALEVVRRGLVRST